ncbi:MAG: endonuclease/exonuclease/phosphatase family protein [Bacteroidetes Order II. Incertae sedis bacterium]|nr:endonuclease/exonuclease/phosphatase family protein [Bacteroidetes Order II. bacterium]
MPNILSNIICISSLCLLIGGCSTSDSPVSVTAMTFNIRWDNPNDGVDGWDLRKDWVSDVITESGAEIIGLQEALLHQIAHLDSSSAGFDWIGVGRDDGKTQGELSPILFDTTKWTVLEWDTRWLSSTPDSVGVAGWDAALPRIATIATLQHVKTQFELRVINTHFDHRGETAKLESAKLIRDWALEGNKPVLVLGDFNFKQHEPPYAALTDTVADRFLRDAGTGDTTSTFKGFDALKPVSGARIDYVLSAGHQGPDQNGQYATYSVIESIRSDRFVSDHLPVLSTLRY